MNGRGDACIAIHTVHVRPKQCKVKAILSRSSDTDACWEQTKYKFKYIYIYIYRCRTISFSADGCHSSSGIPWCTRPPTSSQSQPRAIAAQERAGFMLTRPLIPKMLKQDETVSFHWLREAAICGSREATLQKAHGRVGMPWDTNGQRDGGARLKPGLCCVDFLL